jgi:hypothetical protein
MRVIKYVNGLSLNINVFNPQCVRIQGMELHGSFSGGCQS